MAVSAGRILIMPKGNYNSLSSYDNLDLVNYDGNSWLCKKTCTGITPSDTNSTYWQRFGASLDVDAVLSTTSTNPVQNKVIYSKLVSLQNQITEVDERLAAHNAGAHNAIYRGESLGDTVTATQYAAISAGTFDDLYIGDYWTIGGVNYRIAAFDYYFNSGDTNCTTHHVVIVPDTCLYEHVMNDTRTTTGGYVGSKMYKEGLTQAKTTIKTAFSGHVLNHRVYLTNAVANGRASSGAWCDSEVDLMCEQMVYGSGIFSPVSDGSNVPANYRVETSQLPLFQHESSRVYNRAAWWLRDVINTFGFACISGDGYARYFDTSFSCGVRPFFCIS